MRYSIHLANSIECSLSFESNTGHVQQFENVMTTFLAKCEDGHFVGKGDETTQYDGWYSIDVE
jgi:hypothetical protein